MPVWRTNHAQGKIGNLLGHLGRGVLAQRLLPPGDPVAHADHRERGSPRIDRPELTSLDPLLDEQDEFPQRRPLRRALRPGELVGQFRFRADQHLEPTGIVRSTQGDGMGNAAQSGGWLAPWVSG